MVLLLRNFLSLILSLVGVERIEFALREVKNSVVSAYDQVLTFLM